VRITDTLSADDPQQWEGRFQIPGDLTVSIDRQTVVATDAGTGREMVLSFQSVAPLSFSTCHGQKDPICGWSRNGDEFGPATTLMWTVEQNAPIQIDISYRQRRIATTFAGPKDRRWMPEPGYDAMFSNSGK
jgi:hypothetical protein